MNQSSEQSDSTNWSLTLRILSSDYWLSSITSLNSLFGIPEQTSTRMLHYLPGDILGETLSYLTIPEIKASSILLDRSLFNNLSDIGALGYLKKKKLIERFCYLMAVEGEDNQIKAEKMLSDYRSDSKLVYDMIVGRGNMQDAAGRRFKDISAYGYAFWAGDTRMRKMLKKYMDEDTKAKAYEECKQMSDFGISYTFRDETVTNSKHFDFQPLLNAYQTYFAEANPLVTAKNWSDAAWSYGNELWLNLGMEQSKIPTHVAQEYCSDRPFHPLPTFKERTLNRTVKFNNNIGSIYEARNDSWNFSDVRSSLGIAYLGHIVCFKGDSSRTRDMLRRCFFGGPMPSHGPQSTHLDSVAIAALCQVRTVDELNQTLDDLKPADPGAHLIG